MTRDQLTAFVQTITPDLKLGTNKQFAEFIVVKEQIHLLCKELKQNENTKMDYLFCETAVDRKDGFHMLYHLTSSSFGHSLMLRTVISDKMRPEVASVSDVWISAEFYEREIFDLFGIQFINHPDLRRIFLDDDWVGYPLRKDYKDDFMLAR
jgi:NADH:ubiquinone oxidoreductase subunit C